MTEVIRIDGSPGGGKSTALENHLRDERDGGIGPSGFWWLNFTNSGREDVEPTLAEIYPDAEDVEDRAKTVHGLSLSLCLKDGVIDADDLNDVIIQQGMFGSDETDPYAAFCREEAMAYDAKAANPRKLLSGESDTDKTGNKLFAINDYLRQTCKPPEQWRAAPVNIRTPGPRVKELLEAWDDYKRHTFDKRRFEHGDYVVEAIERTLTPAVDVLLMDEFQDLAPLEYRLYKQWRNSGEIDRIYISGDPNQSIYSFRGGTPYYFKNTDVDATTTLKESYRCPQEIARVGRTILDSHPETDARGFGGKDDGGTVTWPQIRDKYDLRDAVITKTGQYDASPSVMLLARTNYQLRSVMNALQSAGVPFETLGKRGSLWDGEMGQYLAFLNNWANDGQAFAKPNVREVLKALPDGQQRRKRLAKGIGEIVERDGVLNAFGGLTPVETAERLDVRAWERDALVNALEAPADMTPGEVRVGTIHTAKGLEAPCVYLFGNTSKRTVQRYRRNDRHAAEEHRTYYVGATRASEELHIVESFFDSPTAPPIRKLKAGGAE